MSFTQRQIAVLRALDTGDRTVQELVQMTHESHDTIRDTLKQLDESGDVQRAYSPPGAPAKWMVLSPSSMWEKQS